MIPDLLTFSSNLHLVITLVLKKTQQTNNPKQQPRQEHLWYVPGTLQEK